MAHITSRREHLRQRLLAWAMSHKAAPEDTLSDQIEHLLDDVLHEHDTPPLTAPVMLPLDERDENERVVVTGIGLITPFGTGIEPFWNGLESGQSAIDSITLCDVQDMPCQIAGEVRGFEPWHFLSLKDIRRMSRGSQFAVIAGQMALHDAELEITEDTCYDIGAIIASSSTSYPETEQAVETLLQRGPMRVGPLYMPTALPHMSACQVAIHLGLRGYTSSVSTAGAAGAQAIGEAAAIIRRGDATVMLAGGADASISRISLAGLCSMRALSRRNSNPAGASRPFDGQRDGFVPGEGAGVLVLERLSYARKRGATIYAEVAGYASTCDAYHMAQFEPHGEGAVRAMRQALFHANIGPQQVDYINAHAAGTVSGDIVETLAIKQVFDEYASCVPISSIKSMIGHLSGAAGSVEAAAALLALERHIVPPTINQDVPDPQCDLDYVPNAARSAAVQTALCNSFGFGGINAVLVFRRLEGHA
jgi:3-oxoacyl-[acyl-carrier-protein] synthase II